MTEDARTSGKIFKLQNVCAGGGVIAAFNLDENENAVCGSISPDDIDGLEGERFAIYEHFSKEMVVLDKNEHFDLKLENADDFKLYVIVPLENGFGVIGRTDKYISPKTVKEVSQNNIKLFEHGEFAYVENEKLIIENK